MFFSLISTYKLIISGKNIKCLQFVLYNDNINSRGR